MPDFSIANFVPQIKSRCEYHLHLELTAERLRGYDQSRHKSRTSIHNLLMLLHEFCEPFPNFPVKIRFYIIDRITVEFIVILRTGDSIRFNHATFFPIFLYVTLGHTRRICGIFSVILRTNLFYRTPFQFTA